MISCAEIAILLSINQHMCMVMCADIGKVVSVRNVGLQILPTVAVTNVPEVNP